MNKIYKLIFLLYITQTSYSLGFSQNITNDSTKLKAKFMASGVLLNGNATRVLLFNKFDFEYVGKGYNIIAWQDYTYGTANGNKTENDFRSENFIDINPTKKFVPFVRLFFETNFLRQIDFRYQPGAGVAYYFVRNPENTFRTFFALSYENSKYNNPLLVNAPNLGNSTVAYWGGIIGMIGNHRIFNDRVGVNYRLYNQQGFSYKNAYRSFYELGVSYKLSRHIALQTNARYSYEKIVPTGFKPFDFNWTYGLTFSNF